jgi:hypothetical protein
MLVLRSILVPALPGYELGMRNALIPNFVLNRCCGLLSHSFEKEKCCVGIEVLSGGMEIHSGGIEVKSYGN